MGIDSIRAQMIKALAREAQLETQASAQIEAGYAKADRTVADAYSENKVLQSSSFLLEGYTYSEEAEPPESRLSPYYDISEREKVFIYDQARRCLGVIIRSEWISVNFQKDICDDAS